MHLTQRISVQAIPRASAAAKTAGRACGCRPPKAQSCGRVRSHKRQTVIMMADNPLSKAAESVKKAAKDFKENIEDNAKDTAEAREKGFQAPNPGEDDKQPTEEYRSTKLGKSSQKYAPKSDPTDLSSGVAGKDV